MKSITHRVYCLGPACVALCITLFGVFCKSDSISEPSKPFMLEDDERAMRIEVVSIDSRKTWMDTTYVRKCTKDSQPSDTTGGDSGAVIIVEEGDTLPLCVPAQMPCVIIMSQNSAGEQLLPGEYRFRVTIWSNFDTISAESEKEILDTVPVNYGVQAFENCDSD